MLQRYEVSNDYESALVVDVRSDGSWVTYDDALAMIRAAFEAGEARGKGLCGRFRHLYVDVDAAQWIREHVTGEGR